MISKIHWFLSMNVHDNQCQTWRVNLKEKIGRLHNRFEEKSVYKILNCRVNVMISVAIYNRDWDAQNVKFKSFEKLKSNWNQTWLTDLI